MSEFAKDGLMIAGIALGVVAAVAMALRRRQERSIIEDWAARHAWSVESDAAETLRSLSGSSLLQIAHSRRFSAIAADPQGVRLFEYACETGFEHERQQHRWFGACIPIDHRRSRAVFTHEPWVIAVAIRPSYEVIAWPQDSRSNEKQSTGVILAEDPTEWRGRLTTDLGMRLAAEPEKRTWEVLPGCLVGFQPVPADESRISELVSAAKEIALLL